MSNIQTEIAMTQRVVNNEVELYNKIRGTAGKDEQLKKAAAEFESIFISQMFSKMDNTVDREGGIFENDGLYLKNFKSYMYNQIGRDMANNPHNTFGLAKQIYEQMKASLPKEAETTTLGEG